MSIKSRRTKISLSVSAALLTLTLSSNPALGQQMPPGGGAAGGMAGGAAGGAAGCESISGSDGATDKYGDFSDTGGKTLFQNKSSTRTL